MIRFGSTGFAFARGKRIGSWWALLLCAACSSETARGTEGDDRAVFVGEVSDTDARIGLVRDDEGWVAYVCGGPDTMAGLTTWFEGAADEEGSGSAESEGKSLSVGFLGDGVTGTLFSAGDSMDFTAERARGPGPSGVFQTMAGSPAKT